MKRSSAAHCRMRVSWPYRRSPAFCTRAALRSSWSQVSEIRWRCWRSRASRSITAVAAGAGTGAARPDNTSTLVLRRTASSVRPTVCAGFSARLALASTPLCAISSGLGTVRRTSGLSFVPWLSSSWPCRRLASASHCTRPRRPAMAAVAAAESSTLWPPRRTKPARLRPAVSRSDGSSVRSARAPARPSLPQLVLAGPRSTSAWASASMNSVSSRPLAKGPKLKDCGARTPSTSTSTWLPSRPRMLMLSLPPRPVLAPAAVKRTGCWRTARSTSARKRSLRSRAPRASASAADFTVTVAGTASVRRSVRVAVLVTSDSGVVAAGAGVAGCA